MGKENTVKIDRLTTSSKRIINEHMIRKSRKQKDEFIRVLNEELKDCDMAFNVEQYSKSNKNIIVGNLDEAKYVYTAHYDTCATMFVLPNFITPKNILVYIIYQLLLTALLMFIAFIFAYLSHLIFKNSDFAFKHIIPSFTFMVVMILILLQLMVGYRNKNNYNDNTSGVITLVEMIKSLPEELKNKTCFVFFDNEEKGLLGSSQFAKKHKKIMSDKILINFDCVSDGDNLLLVHKKIDNVLLSKLEEYKYDDKNIVLTKSTKAFYPSDQAKFKNSTIAVCALKKNKILGLYMDRIHTYRDIIFEQRNIEVLKELFINIIE